VGVVPFEGNYNIWMPVGHGLCVQARLARLAGNRQAWEDVMARIRAHPVNATNNPEAAHKPMAELPREIGQHAQDPSLVFAREGLCMMLMELNYYQECGLAAIDQRVSVRCASA